MPQLPREVVKHRAARLRAAAEAALGRHLEARMGAVVNGLVEREGLARAEDFTEIALEGFAPAGTVVPVLLTGHDGRRALGRLAA
jgi:threonylcarbamoyladenosine tRNA methylthiotransferase MtaB